VDFLKRLLEIPSLEEIQLFMRNSRYNEAVREGVLYFRNNKEIFVLESFLDLLYYQNLIVGRKKYGKKERKMVDLFIDYKTEIYNLNVLFRGINNKIEKKLLSQFLIRNFLFLDESKLNVLLNLESIDDFVSTLGEFFNRTEKISRYYNTLKFNRKHLIWSIEKIYLEYYFKKFRVKIDDIDYLTIYKIIEVILLKEKEIEFEIIPKVVNIINEKYRILKSYV
jgi:vacuolar-type H+-ATPase subunit C/Vma6